MPERHLLTREQLNEIINFAAKEGEFGEHFQVGIDEVLLDQMISTMLMGFKSEVTEDVDLPDIFDWIDVGVKNGWCSHPTCDTHDGVPMTDEEMEEWDQGHDPCMHVLRLWGD